MDDIELPATIIKDELPVITIKDEHGKSSAAAIIFIVVFAFHFFAIYIENMKKKGSMDAKDVKLRSEIKQLLKEASSYSQPSTFAQAAKLRRTAAAKEKELAKNQEMREKNIKNSYDLFLKVVLILKVCSYVALVLWFWRSPVAAISQQLVQPFGWLLSWGGGSSSNENVMVGVIPWLIVSTRVGKFLCRKIFNQAG